MLRDATQATLLDILDSSRIPYEMNKAENILEFEDCGSRILFRAVDDFERLRGTNLAWFGLDELTYTPEAAWLRLEGRLRDPLATKLCGFGVWTPKGFDWVHRRFISGPPEGYDVIVARPFENTVLLGQIPDFYKRLEGSYDPLFYRQEVLGEYLNVTGGLVYHAFERQKHLTELNVDPALPMLWALDFNVDPMSSVVAQIDTERIRVIDEIVLRRSSTADACRCFLDRYGRHPAGIIVYGDASGRNQQTTGNSDYEVISEFFGNERIRAEYRVPRANPSVRDRVTLVNAKLRTASGDVLLVVDRRCKELVKDFEQVSYVENTTDIDKTKDKSRTHLTDALGYLIWQECRTRAPIGERSEPLCWF
ncbi:MAG: hypothetical protein ACKV22_14785 [Bryobacteraceae bacterium]